MSVKKEIKRRVRGMSAQRYTLSLQCIVLSLWVRATTTDTAVFTALAQEVPRLCAMRTPALQACLANRSDVKSNANTSLV